MAKPPVNWIKFVSSVHESQTAIMQMANSKSASPDQIEPILSKVEIHIKTLIETGDLIELDIRLMKIEERDKTSSDALSTFISELGVKYGGPVSREMLGMGVAFLMKHGGKIPDAPNGLFLKLRMPKGDLEKFLNIGGKYIKKIK